MVEEVLDNSEEIVKKIMDESDLSKEEIEEKIEEKREKYGGLLTEAGAAYSIAKDLGIEEEKPPKKRNKGSQEVKIKEVSNDQKNVDLEARVKRIYATKEFQREEREGDVTNLEIKDDTGEIKVALWNKKPVVEKMNKNDPIKITNGYVKERNDEIEINVGSYGSIEILEESEIPEIEKKEETTDKIKPGMDNIDIYARVERVFPMNKFKKGEREGKVTNILIRDEKGKARLVLWGEQAEKAQELNKNDLIKVEGAYTKEANMEREGENNTEIHLGWKGRFKTNPENAKEIPKIKTERKTIPEIKEMSPGETISTKATIMQAYEPTIIPVCPECGSMARENKCKEHGEIEEVDYVPILNIMLDDGADVIRGTLYREKAEKIIGVKGEELRENGEKFTNAKREILGQEKIFTGRVKENESFNRKEFTITSFQDVDINEEISLLKENKK